MVIRSGAAANPVIREHRIPTPDSRPYIITLGPDDHLWYCESGTSKSGSRAIIVIPDGRVFFSEHDAGQIGEIIPPS